MAEWQASAGATLLVPSGPEGKHLFVVLCDPVVLQGYGPNPCVVMVNLSTVRPGIPYDSTCVLKAGEHPFVTQDSYVVYGAMRVDRVSDLAQRVAQGYFTAHEPMPAQVLARIQAGRTVSPRTTREFKLLPI
jgi:hypothetical protein